MRIAGWGCGESGQLGSGLPSDLQPKPRLLPDLAHVTDPKTMACVAAGLSLSLVVPRGAPAPITLTRDAAPQDADLPSIVATASGHDFTLLVSAAGALLVSGAGGHGELAHGPNVAFLARPTVVSALEDVKIVAVAAGAMHWLALDANARVYACGLNSNGQCGNGSTTTLYKPQCVSALWAAPVVHISAGESHSAVLTAAGDVFCFGSNKHGQIGQPALSLKVISAYPARVPVALDPPHVSPGSDDAAAESSDTLASAPTMKDTDGDAIMSPAAPVELSVSPTETVSADTNLHYVDVACGGRHTVALRSDGVLACWGLGERGQVGSRSTANAYLPVVVRPSAPNQRVKFMSVSAGARHSAAVTDKGEAFMWGDGTLGQIGDGDMADKLLPVPISAPKYAPQQMSDDEMSTDIAEDDDRSEHSTSLSGALPHFVRIICGGYHNLAFVSASRSPFNAGEEYFNRIPKVAVDGMLNAKAGYYRLSSAAVLYRTFVPRGCPSTALRVRVSDAVKAYSSFRGVFSGEGDKILIAAAARLRLEALSALGMLSAGDQNVFMSPPAAPTLSELSLNGEVKSKTTSTGDLASENSFRSEVADMRETGVLLFLVFLNPVYEWVDARERVRELAELASIIIRIQGEARAAFISCVRTCAPEFILKCIVRPLQSLITDELRLKKRVTKRTIHATKVIGLCYEGNERKRMAAVKQLSPSSYTHAAVRRRILDEGDAETSTVRVEEFYNEAVSDMIDLQQDFLRWRNASDDHSGDGGDGGSGSDRDGGVEGSRNHGRSGGGPSRESFSFCEYSFLLNKVAKFKILRIEAHETMNNEMFHSVLSAGSMSMPMHFTHAQALFMVLHVRRSHIVTDTFSQLDQCAKRSPRALHKTLKIEFEGEAGQDEGGLTKEFFQVLTEQVFSKSYGMFDYDEETRYHWFNRNSLEEANDFFLVGIAIGLALFNSILLDIQFPPVIYRKLHVAMRKILKQSNENYEATLEDVKEVFPAIGTSLSQLLDYEGDDVEDVFCLTFEVPFEGLFGKPETAELVPGGGSKAVTSSNKAEFVQLYINHLINDSIGQQFMYFATGLFFMMNGDFVAKLTPDELETLVVGEKELDFEALRATCKYEGYTPNSTAIEHLWTVLFELDTEMRQKFLSFVCGSDRAPIGGLGNLGLIIQRSGGDSDRLPTAHTCFNVLLLPEYSSRAKLRSLLLLAIQNSQGFGLQ